MNNNYNISQSEQKSNSEKKEIKNNKKSTLGHWIAIISIFSLLTLSVLINIVLIIIIASNSLATDKTSEKYTEEVIYGSGNNKVVCIEAYGVISFAKTSAGFFQEDGLATKIIKQIEHAEKDKNVVAILLIVDSPGGGVTASDIIFQKLNHFKNSRKDRKVVTLFRDLAASGGYYIGVAGNKIISYRTSVTGSIGVILSALNFKTLSEKIGVKDVTIKSGKHKDILNPFRTASKEELQILQNVINDLYDRFLTIVAESRNLPIEKIKPYADGSIFSAQKALAIGLIDEIGNFDSAINSIKELTGINKIKVIKYKKNISFFDLFSSKLNLTPNIKIPFAQSINSDYPSFQYLWKPTL